MPKPMLTEPTNPPTSPTSLPDFPLTDTAAQVPLSQPTVDPSDPMPAEELPTDVGSAPATADDSHVHISYSPDYRALDAANGDSDLWADELFELIGHTTGQWIDKGTLETWLGTLALQVRKRTFKEAAFQVANTTLPAQVSGDPAFLLLQLRDDLVSGLKRGA